MTALRRNYNSGDQIEENTGKAHGTYLGWEKCEVVVGKHKEIDGRMYTLD